MAAQVSWVHLLTQGGEVANTQEVSHESVFIHVEILAKLS